MLDIKNTKISLDTLIENKNKSEETIKRARNADLLILPDVSKIADNQEVFQPDTVSFYKYAKHNLENYNIEIFENKGEEKFLSLRSFDIWLPTIYICENVLIPFVIGLASSYIYNRLEGRCLNKSNVHFNLIVNNKDKSKSISYDGPAETFEKQFNKIDINELWKE